VERRALAPQPLDATDTPDGVRLFVWAKPRAARSRVVGVRAGLLEVALAAAPADGAANAELVETLAAWLRVPRSRVSLVAGHGGRRKLVAISGCRLEDVKRRLAGPR